MTPGSMRVMLKTGLMALLALSLLASSASIAAADLPAPPGLPDLPPPGGGSSGGGSTASWTQRTIDYSTYATPTPVPEPVPPDELDVSLHDTFILNGVEVRVKNNTMSVPEGTLFKDVFKNDTPELPLAGNDNNSTATLILAVDSSRGGSSASIKAIRLVTGKELVRNDTRAGISITAVLNGLPSDGALTVDLLSPGSADVRGANEQLAAYGGIRLDGPPLALVDIKRTGVENGRDIASATITFKVPRPGGFDPGATYLVLRQSDGMQELLNATLVSGPSADPLVFEAGSPHGFSTFTLVKVTETKPSMALARADTLPAPTAAHGPMGNIAIVLAVFVAGIIVGAVPIILLFRRLVAIYRRQL